MLQRETSIICPFCAEAISILVDTSVDQQSYIEDCSVCCRPILIHINCDNEQVQSITIQTSQ